MAQGSFPAPENVELPGSIVARSGFLSEVPGAHLRGGEVVWLTDKAWGCFGDESQAGNYWPTSKSSGDFDWKNINPIFDNIDLNTINHKTLQQIVDEAIQNGPTPVITILNTNVIKTVYGPGADFTDLDAAYLWLSQRTISSQGSVTLNFPAIKITETKNYTFKHPNGERIIWNGANLKQALPALSAFQVSDNTPAARAVDGVANLALMRQTFATEIAFTNGGGINMMGDLGQIKNMLLTSDGSSINSQSGMGMGNGRCGLNNVGIYGFAGNGLVINLSGSFYTVAGSFVYIVNCNGNGIVTVANSFFNFTYGSVGIFGNGNYGAWIRDNSLNYAYPAIGNSNPTAMTIAGNGLNGLFLTTSIFAGTATLIIRKNGNGGIGMVSGARFNMQAITVTQNTGPGAYVDGFSTMSCPNSTFTNNSTYGISAYNGSYVFQGGSTVSGNTTANFTPAVGSVGNTGALITN